MLQPNEEATNFTFRYFQFYIIKKLSIILLHLTLALISTTKEFSLQGLSQSSFISYHENSEKLKLRPASLEFYQISFGT